MVAFLNTDTHEGSGWSHRIFKTAGHCIMRMGTRSGQYVSLGPSAHYRVCSINPAQGHYYSQGDGYRGGDLV